MVIARRQFVAGALTLIGGAARAGSARALPPERLAAIDWAMMDTALALGQVPVAACELRQFRARVAQPVLPLGVTDLGLRGSPNLELLQICRPDLILSSPFYSSIETQLTRIAPVEIEAFYYQPETPWTRCLAALPALAERLGDRAAGAARADALAEQVAGAGQGLAARPLYLVEIGDARHLRVFGTDSLFGSVAQAMGLETAWDRPTQFSFAAPVPLQALAEREDAAIVICAPVPALARGALERSALWQALPAVRAGRVYQLSGLNAYGGPLAGADFALRLRAALGAL
ncbi:ABC transporter substrate-binding protein (plasmid) [Thioclava sp. 'Guangxiensis']|uniref:ABC transporter substrate-binding protein n=1 Tax=Thioclava sp. 'Guangxiensis' TaxID=3149044 RepID=UPI0032C47BE5